MKRSIYITAALASLNFLFLWLNLLYVQNTVIATINLSILILLILLLVKEIRVYRNK